MAAKRIPPVEEIWLLRAANRDARLSRGDIGVFSVILEHCNAQKKSFPGPKRISGMAHLHLSNVKASLAKLERLRYIDIDRPGPRKANKYAVRESPAEGARKASWIKRPGGVGKPSADEVVEHAPAQSTGPADAAQLGSPTRQESTFNSQLLNNTPHSVEKINEQRLEEARLERKSKQAEYALLCREFGDSHGFTRLFVARNPCLEGSYEQN